MFKIAYKDTYKEIKFKFILFLFFYEGFIIFRAIDYLMRQYDLYSLERSSYWHRVTEVTYYVMEIIFITFISFVGYKNMKNNQKTNVPENFDIEQNVRSSFMAFS